MYKRYSIFRRHSNDTNPTRKKSVTNANERQLLIKMINLMVKVISDFNFKLHLFFMSKIKQFYVWQRL